MDTDSLKRLLLLCLVVAGCLVSESRARAAEGELSIPAPLVTTAPTSTTAVERPGPQQRKAQFRARLLRHWWSPRTMAVAPSRRPSITKII